MDREAFIETLGQYMGEDDLKRAKSMLEMTESEFIAQECKKINVPGIPQNLVANVFLRTHTSRDCGYVIADILIENKSGDDSDYTIEVEIDHATSFTVRGHVAGKTTVFDKISCPDDRLFSYLDIPAYCRADVFDSIGRGLCSVSGEITVLASMTRPKIKASIELSKGEIDHSKTGSLGRVFLKSSEDVAFTILVRVMFGRDVISILPLKILSEDSRNVEIFLNDSDRSRCNAGKKISVIVDCDGFKLCDSSVANNSFISDENDKPKESILSIFAECSVQRIIDINAQSDGNVAIGILSIKSAEKETQRVTVSAQFEEEMLFTSTVVVAPNSKTNVIVTAPVRRVQRDDTYQAEARFTVKDCNGIFILDRMFSMIVRSRFDLDLTKLKEQTASAVNPLDPKIQEFVDRSDGPLAKEMGDSYEVSGYQQPEMILPQIEAVFKAVQSLGMHYVSDTETLRVGHYQRVRTPSKVLNDRSGNCIELSILYASILEAMSFETVVVFPYGHAIVGVVLHTDSYRSSATMPRPPCNGVLSLRNGRERYKVVCFEATMCSSKECSFIQAVESAYRTISEELDSINSRSDYTIVEKERQRGIKPRVD